MSIPEHSALPSGFDPAAVLADVVEPKLSIAHARAAYAVVIAGHADRHRRGCDGSAPREQAVPTVTKTCNIVACFGERWRASALIKHQKNQPLNPLVERSIPSRPANSNAAQQDSS
jgi:hypothetical protein